MLLKLLVFIFICQAINAHNYNCSPRSATLLLKRSTYTFSMKILQRVAQETDAHFVYSPLSSWLQLVSLAEGARGKTLREIWQVTRHHKNNCFKRKLRAILYQMNRDAKFEFRRRSLLIIDNLMDVKRRYIRDVQRLYGAKVLLCDFNNSTGSAALANGIIRAATNGRISQIVYYDDFINSVLLVSDALFFRTFWRYPFNVMSTKREPFYSEKGSSDVWMMNQKGFFNITEVSKINAKILELPCMDGRFSMLIFLPVRRMWIGDMLYSMQSIYLSSIFNMFKHRGVRYVDVKLPRFKITTNVENVPELVFDMGIKSIFDPDKAELNGISNFKMHASLITQSSDIEVTEKGVKAREEIGFLDSNNSAISFVANKPFAFMIVDRRTEFIVFAGIYSSPSIY